MASRRYIVDRIENGSWAVLETSDGSGTVELPREWLPGEVGEGVVLRAEVEGDGLVRFRVDEGATDERARRLEELRDELPRGPSGDLEL